MHHDTHNLANSEEKSCVLSYTYSPQILFFKALLLACPEFSLKQLIVKKGCWSTPRARVLNKLITEEDTANETINFTPY